MTISADILKNYKKLRQPADANLIASELSVSPEYIRRALRGGECSEKLAKSIAKFYNKRKNNLKKLLK